MPALSRWFIRASLVYLGLGVTLGGLLLANKGLDFYPLIWRSLPAHIEFLFLGWMVQVVLGVAYWILPRLPGSAPHGNERLAFLAFVLLNLGIWLIVAQSIFLLLGLSLAGRLLESLGAALFLVAVWPRIKPFGQ
jgi:heme/copper-type cytochrome/quinol oxidase subunit 1